MVTMNERNETGVVGWKKAALAVIVLAVVARLAFLLIVTPRLDGVYWDGDGYLNYATKLREDRWEEVHRPPVYVALCAVLQLLPGETLTWVRALNVLMDVGIVWLILRHGKHLAGPKAAILGAALYAIYPLALWRMSYANSEIIATLTLTGLLVAYERLSVNRRWFHWAAAGAAFAVLLLVKDLYKFLPAVLLVYWLWKFRTEPRRVCFGFAVWAVATAIVVAPWTYRNYRVTGELIPIAAGLSGKAMFIGNHVPSEGRWVGEYEHLWRESLREFEEANPDLTPKEKDRELTAATLKHIRENVSGWLTILPKKAFRFWFVPASETRIALTIAVQLAFLGLALLGAIRARDRLGSLLLPGLVLGYTWALYTLSYSCVRFSLIAMPWVCLLGGWVLAERNCRQPEPNSRQKT